MKSPSCLSKVVAAGELRPKHPLLSPRQRLGVLEEEGFEGAASLPEAESDDEQYFQQALILARVAKDVAELGRALGRGAKYAGGED